MEVRYDSYKNAEVSAPVLCLWAAYTSDDRVKRRYGIVGPAREPYHVFKALCKNNPKTEHTECNITRTIIRALTIYFFVATNDCSVNNTHFNH